MKQEVEDRKLHRMAKVHNFLEMWQGSQNLRATYTKARTQHRQLTAVGYISDTEEIVKAFWSLFQHDGVAALKLSERSPLPPALSAKDLNGGQTQILNIRQIGRINRHPLDGDGDCAPEGFSDAKNYLNWHGHLDNPNNSEDDCAADNESDIEQNNGIEDLECPEQQNVSAAPNVPGLVQPTRKSERRAEIVLVMVNANKTRKNKGLKRK